MALHSSYALILLSITFVSAAAAAKLLQSCLTLCHPMDGSPPGSPVHGILQARTLEWVAISFSNAWKWKVKVKLLSCVWPSATPWTTAFQAPPSMGFSRQGYWSGVPLPFQTFVSSVCVKKYRRVLCQCSISLKKKNNMISFQTFRLLQMDSRWLQ